MKDSDRAAEKLEKLSGKAATDEERQETARKIREWNLMDTSGKALTEQETERLLKQTFRK